MIEQTTSDRFKNYVIGVDFGTDSVRSILMDALDGKELSSSVFYYPRWKEGLYCNPLNNQFRQHPLDYIEGLEHTLKKCISILSTEERTHIRAISVDTTGSSPVAVNKEGMPLALLPAFRDNPNAMFVLWKDHTATQEAAAINEHALKFDTDYLQFVGGIYSSEWFWAKLWHILRVDKQVREACYSWVEHCDWIPFLLTGGNDVGQLKRSVCAAGHKSLWAAEWGGLPPASFFSSLDEELLSGFRDRLFTETFTADKPAGNLCDEWAGKLGLSPDVLIGIGAFDAHMGAVGGQIEPYVLSKVMGTSTCDILVVPIETGGDVLVKGICGQVPGSVIPGMMGMEAGQSGFGDIYAWFRNLISWPLKQLFADDKARLLVEHNLIQKLSDKAALIPLREDDELAIDWLNGRRTPDANQLLKGAISGLTLATDAPRFFKALAEATCFGAKAIVDRFNQQGIPVKGLIGIGGVARKSPYIMQMMADVLNMEIKIHNNEQTCAVGAAMFAATVAGIYPDVNAAMHAMGSGFDKVYYPDSAKADLYKKRYHQYQKLGAFLDDGVMEKKQINTF